MRRVSFTCCLRTLLQEVRPLLSDYRCAMSAEEPNGSKPRRTSDVWSLSLGLAVVALTGISTLGWLETRQLADRVSKLEGGGPSSAGAGDDGTVNPVDNPEKQFTRLNGTLSIRDSAYKGDPAAPVVLVEYSTSNAPSALATSGMLTNESMTATLPRAKCDTCFATCHSKTSIRKRSRLQKLQSAADDKDSSGRCMTGSFWINEI